MTQGSPRMASGWEMTLMWAAWSGSAASPVTCSGVHPREPAKPTAPGAARSPNAKVLFQPRILSHITPSLPWCPQNYHGRDSRPASPSLCFSCQGQSGAARNNTLVLRFLQISRVCQGASIVPFPNICRARLTGGVFSARG